MRGTLWRPLLDAQILNHLAEIGRRHLPARAD